MMVDNAEEWNESSYRSKTKVINRTLRNKMVMYKSFTDMSPITASSMPKIDREARQQRIQARLRIRSFSTTKQDDDVKSKSQVADQPTAKNLIFTQQNIKRNTRMIALKKESFLTTTHHGIQYIRFHFSKSGGSHEPNKQMIIEEVEKIVPQFPQWCQEGQWENIESAFTKIMNYCIDFNLIRQFTILLIYLAEIFLNLGFFKQATFYYIQSRVCTKGQMDYPLLIDSLIGIAKCCSKASQHSSAIVILKKALEYAWHIGDKEKQLIIYDEIGQKYYMMGQVGKAHYYHERFSTGGYEKQSSAVKLMVKIKVMSEESKQIRNKLTSIDRIFLVSLNVPIMDLKQLPSQIGQESLRSIYTNNIKRFSDPYGQPERQVARLLRQRDFDEETPQPRYQENQEYLRKWEQRKTAYPEMDFQLNRWMINYTKRVTRKHSERAEARVQRPKVNLDDRIEQRLHRPPMSESWYKDMVDRIVRQNNSNLSSLRNQILVRGAHKQGKLSQRFYSVLFNTFYIELLFC